MQSEIPSVLGGIGLFLEECSLVCTIEPPFIKAHPLGQDEDSLLFSLSSKFLTMELLYYKSEEKKAMRSEMVTMIDLSKPGFSEKLRRNVHHNLGHRPTVQPVLWSMDFDPWITTYVQEDRDTFLITSGPKVIRPPNKIRMIEFTSKLPYVDPGASNTEPGIGLGRESEASRLQRYLPVGGCNCSVCGLLAIQSSLK